MDEITDHGLPPLNLELAAVAALRPADPHRVYLKMLARRPVAWTPRGAVAVFGMEDVLEINRHPGIAGSGGSAAPKGSLGAERPLIPLDIDGKEHRKYRRLLDPLFSPKRVAEWEPIVRARANELVDGFIGAQRAELYLQFCTPLPSSIFVDIMGIPRGDRDAFITFAGDVVRPQGRTIEEMVAFSQAAGKRAYAYFEDLLEERGAATPSHADLIAMLMAAEVDGERLTRRQIIDIVYLLMIAGVETTVASLSCLFAWLAQHAAERQWILDDPNRWPDAIEELIRFESPVMYGNRTALEDVHVGGRFFPKGTHFDVSWSAANLDPAVFEDPLNVHLDRDPNLHVGFASGFHRCLGSHLARLELRIAMNEFHRRIPEYRIDPSDQLAYSAVAVRRAHHLPIVWDS